MNNHHHHIAHYAIVLAAVAVLALHRSSQPLRQPVIVQGHVSPGFGFAEAAPKPVKNAWPPLGEDKTIKLGEALMAMLPGSASSPTHVKLLIFCSSDRCKSLAEDVDDATQIAAGWESDTATSAIGADEEGLLVGPPGPAASALSTSLASIGFEVRVVDMSVGTSDVGLIIGKAPKGRP